MAWFRWKSREGLKENPGDDALLDMIARHEGFSPFPYHCPTGRLTVGYGHNLEEPMDENLAWLILKNDVGRTVRELCDVFPRLLAMSKVRQYVLIDMCYNLGITRFRKFVKMIEAVNNEDWETAVAEMIDSAWYRQVGNRAEELVNLMKGVAQV